MKECIILAGGLGTRLQQVVKDVPKCMAEIANKPFLFYLLEYLKDENITHLILALGHKADVVLNWLENKNYPFEISYVIEKEPLGTGGAIRYAMSKASCNEVFIINGDTYFPINLSSLTEAHHSSKANISLALKPMLNFDRYGSVILNDENQIVEFREKQFCESGLINGGIYLINREFYLNLPLSSKFSFEKDVLENKELEIAINGFRCDTYFIDIGIPSDYEKANVEFEKFK